MSVFDGDGAAALGSGEPFHARLLFSDLRVAYMLFGECRYRIVARLFGVSRDQAPLVAAIGAGLLLKAAHDKVIRALTAAGESTVGDAAFGASAANVALHRIAGPSSADLPAFGALIAIALLGHGARPAVRASVHGVRASGHQVHSTFDHRYGHLSRPLHRRQTEPR